LVIGNWLLVTGNWLLVIGYWQSIIGDRFGRSGGLRLSSDKQVRILAYQLTKVNNKTAKIVKIFGRPELAEWVYWSFLFILSTVEWVYQRKPFFAKKTLFMP